MSIHKFVGQTYPYLPIDLIESEYPNINFPVYFTFGGFTRKEMNNCDHYVELWYLRDNFNQNTISIYISRIIVSKTNPTYDNSILIEQLDNLLKLELSSFRIKWMLNILNNTIEKNCLKKYIIDM